MITHENIEIIHYFLQVDKAPFKVMLAQLLAEYKAIHTPVRIVICPEIFTLFKNVADGGRTPAVHIFESLVFVHALAVLGKVSRRNKHLFRFQFAGDLIPNCSRQSS